MTIDSRQDCYFFLADGCTKGAMCSFRHNEVCKTNKVLCPDWSTTKICKTDNCDKLHSTFHVPNQPVAQASKAEIQCYWELNGGCLKPTCPFKHSMPKTIIPNVIPKPSVRPVATQAINTQVVSPLHESDSGSVDNQGEAKSNFSGLPNPYARPFVPKPGLSNSKNNGHSVNNNQQKISPKQNGGLSFISSQNGLPKHGNNVAHSNGTLSFVPKNNMQPAANGGHGQHQNKNNFKNKSNQQNNQQQQQQQNGNTKETNKKANQPRSINDRLSNFNNKENNNNKNKENKANSRAMDKVKSSPPSNTKKASEEQFKDIKVKSLEEILKEKRQRQAKENSKEGFNASNSADSVSPPKINEENKNNQPGNGVSDVNTKDNKKENKTIPLPVSSVKNEKRERSPSPVKEHIIKKSKDVNGDAKSTDENAIIDGLDLEFEVDQLDFDLDHDQDLGDLDLDDLDVDFGL